MTRTLGRHRAGPHSAVAPADQPSTPPVGSASAPPAAPAAVGDAELLAAVRAGDTAAFGVLYDRHRDAARRLSRVLVRDPSDAEDLVADALARVLAALRAGRGPEVAFRAYLLTAVRHACYDRARKDRRIELTEDLSKYESADGSRGTDAADPAVARLERSYAAQAFAKLPERWRTVLWHTEVEGEKPATVAVMLGLSPNAVAALAYRARERLRQMYLQEHLNATANPACHWTADRLGAHVRGGLARRERSRVDSHLAACPDCQVLWTELADVNSGLRGVLGPLVLGAAAPPYLAALPSVSWWASVAGWGLNLVGVLRGWWSALVGWCREQVQRYGPGNVAAGVGIAVAAVAGIGLFVLALALGPDGPAEPPAAAEPGPPVPAPAPDRPLDPPPAAPSGGPATPVPDEVPAAVGAPAEPAAPARPPPASGPPGPDRVEVAPDLSATSLAAGAPGELAIAVSLPTARPAESGTPPPSESGTPPPPPESITDSIYDTPGDTPEQLHDQLGGWVGLVVEWPAGITLTGADAGDEWRCTAVATETGTGAQCRRPAWPASESRTARLPVAVAETLGGFAPIDLAVTAGELRGDASARVPVAPVGLRVGYAVSGRYQLAMAGNTWLSCPDRPECLRADPLDNDLVPMAPYLPDGDGGGPAVPPGLAEPPAAASGAELAVPARAEVAWAGLHWATTAAELPEQVQVFGPGVGWQAVRADEVGKRGPLRQAYADLTGLVRDGGAGAWWLATGTGLPTGRGPSAGWSLTVVYAHPDAPRRDLAVFTDPVSLTEDRPLSATASAAGGEVEVGLVLWEGDRRLPGDMLRLDGQPLGDPDNLAASRAAGALECGGTPAGECGWHTFGVDVARYRGAAGAGPGSGTVTLHSAPDRIHVGVLVLAVEGPR